MKTIEENLHSAQATIRAERKCRIKVVNIDNDDEVKIFSNIKEASIYTKVRVRDIRDTCIRNEGLIISTYRKNNFIFSYYYGKL